MHPEDTTPLSVYIHALTIRDKSEFHWIFVSPRPAGDVEGIVRDFVWDDASKRAALWGGSYGGESHDD